MAITVDETFLDRASKVNDTIANQVVASPEGDIKGITLRPGQNFGLGNTVRTTVANAGAEVHARLVEIRDTARARSNQLNMFIAVSDDTEDWNNLTAKDFFTNTPAWSTGNK